MSRLTIQTLNLRRGEDTTWRVKLTNPDGTDLDDPETYDLRMAFHRGIPPASATSDVDADLVLSTDEGSIVFAEDGNVEINVDKVASLELDEAIYTSALRLINADGKPITAALLSIEVEPQITHDS